MNTRFTIEEENIVAIYAEDSRETTLENILAAMPYIDDKVYSNPQKRLSNCPRKDKKRTGARCRKSATAPLFSMGYSSSVKINSLSENSLSVMACSLFTAAAASWRISSSM